MSDMRVEPTFSVKQDIEGFAVKDVNPGEMVPISTSGFYMSNDMMFYIISNNICKLYGLDLSKINKLLILIHSDEISDIYLNDFHIDIYALLKRDLPIGESVEKKDFLSIGRIEFPGINILPTDKIIWIIKHNGHFGLYFTLSSDRTKIDIQEINYSMASCFRNLIFFEEAIKLSNEKVKLKFINDGWFPFIHLFGNGLQELLNYYSNEESSENDLRSLLKVIIKPKILDISDKWWNNEIFNERRVILESGIKAYLNSNTEDPSGIILSINTLFPAIEGIIRILYYKEHQKNPKTNDLIEFVNEKAIKKFDSNLSLLEPEDFFEYLSKNTFANFNLGSSTISTSRHSVSHGVASTSGYTEMKALQAIFTLDQLYWYLS